MEGGGESWGGVDVIGLFQIMNWCTYKKYLIMSFMWINLKKKRITVGLKGQRLILFYHFWQNRWPRLSYPGYQRVFWQKRHYFFSANKTSGAQGTHFPSLPYKMVLLSVELLHPLSERFIWITSQRSYTSRTTRFELANFSSLSLVIRRNPILVYFQVFYSVDVFRTLENDYFEVPFNFRLFSR